MEQRQLEIKKCTLCLKSKAASDFARDPKGRNGLSPRCKKCLLMKQRDRRAKDNNAVTKKYEKTKRGFIMRMYRNMKSRVDGVQKKCSHLYSGLPLINKDEFYTWVINQESFHRLFEEYENKGYPRKLAPTVDRIDYTRGYCENNIEVVTLSENVKRGRGNKSLSEDSVRKLKEIIRINPSIKEVCEQTNYPRHIVEAIKYGRTYKNIK